MSLAIFLIIAFAFVVLIYFIIKCKNGKRVLCERFKRGNVIVFGKKGTGKDLVFNKVINARKRPCYANIPFNEKYCTLRQIKFFTVAPNTYKDFINDTVKVVRKVNAEKTDFYISDGGIMLPSQYHSMLDKLYPSLPIYYATSRHLTYSNIHINTQHLPRPWDKLREQADCYVRCERTVKVFGWFFTSFIVYDFYESAKAGLQPFPHNIFSGSFNTAAFNEFTACHGSIKRYLIAQRKKDIKYDTRYFHCVLYGEPAPSRSLKSSKK